MTRITIAPNASGTGVMTLAAPNTNTDRTLTLPNATGTVNISGLANEVPAGSAGSPSIYPTGDSNTGVFFPAADTVAVTTAGVEAMRVNSSGNVGIGTSSPGADLAVQGFSSYRGNLYTIASFAANATLAPLNIIQSSDGTNPSISAGQNSDGTYAPLAFFTSNAERMQIDASGAIGIGGANYGTSGQVLTSGGSGAAPSWTSRGFASATLTNKTGSRANGTTYQNTTNGWLFVSVKDSNNGQSFSVGPSSASLTIFNTNIAPGTAIGLVPPLYYYSISGSVLQSWYEGQA